MTTRADPARLHVSDHGALFDTALGWIADGHGVALATVTKTWGSAPRAAGSFLAVRADGMFAGSVSGGCVEGDVIVAAQDALRTGMPALLTFGVSTARAWEVGLACGGEISILVYPADAAQLQVAQTQTAAGRPAEFALPHEAAPRLVLEPAPRLAIIGAVHVTQVLAPMARLIGIDVLVIDPRSAFLSAARFPDVALSADWPDDALAAWAPDHSSAIVALTHDPKIDDVALAAALRSPAFYIAALGSRKNHAARCERLALQGFPDADIRRIYGPAGLDIAASGPAEIATSILAQLIATRHQRAP